MAQATEYAEWLGVALFFGAYVWAFVLASRVSGRWLLAMLFLGYLLYPWFAAKHWGVAKRNTLVMLSGLAIVCGAIVIRVASR